MTKYKFIVCNHYNIAALYDDFEDLGFKKVGKYPSKKFNKDIEIMEICLKEEDFIND